MLIFCSDIEFHDCCSFCVVLQAKCKCTLKYLKCFLSLDFISEQLMFVEHGK